MVNKIRTRRLVLYRGDETTTLGFDLEGLEIRTRRRKSSGKSVRLCDESLAFDGDT